MSKFEIDWEKEYTFKGNRADEGPYEKSIKGKNLSPAQKDLLYAQFIRENGRPSDTEHQQILTNYLKVFPDFYIGQVVSYDNNNAVIENIDNNSYQLVYFDKLNSVHRVFTIRDNIVNKIKDVITN